MGIAAYKLILICYADVKGIGADLIIKVAIALNINTLTVWDRVRMKTPNLRSL